MFLALDCFRRRTSVIRLDSGQRNGRATLRGKWVTFPGAGIVGRGGSRHEASDKSLPLRVVTTRQLSKNRQQGTFRGNLNLLVPAPDALSAR
jgi:hypothetical protein